MNAKHTTIKIRILALLTCLFITSMYGSVNAQKGAAAKTPPNKASKTNFKITIKSNDHSSIEPRTKALKTKDGDETEAILQCSNWDLYVTDKDLSAGINGLHTRKIVNASKAPLEIRLNPDFSAYTNWYKITLSEEYCGHLITLNGTGPIYAIQHGQSHNGHYSCSIDDMYARYRILYDFDKQLIRMQRRDKDAIWHDLNKSLIRPAVNQFIHFDVINYNPLRDSLSLNYQFENLNLEGSQELIAALMRTPVPTSEDKDQTEAVGGSPESGDGAKKIHTPIPQAVPKRTTSELRDDLTAVLDHVEGEWTAITKTNLSESLAYATFLDMYSKSNLNPLGKPSEAKKLSESEIRSKFENDDEAVITEFSDTLIKISDTFDKITAYQAAYELTQLAIEFNKKLEEEKQLTVAPDRSRLKSDLKVMIAKAEALKTFASIPSDKAADVAKTLKAKLEAAGVEASALEDLEKKGKEIDSLYEKMTNYSTSYFAPIQMQDFDRLNIHFVSGKKKVNATPYRIYSKGGWKIDFSAGFSISNLNNKSYYYSDVTSETVVTGTNVVGGDTTITTREDKYGTIGLKKDAPDWSICTMAHLYPRTGLVFNPAIAFGAQISQDNVALLFGFSALFGREQRLALSGGVALGSATRLKAGYEVDDVVIDANAVKQGDVTFTQERRVAGAFASLTYNLGGITKSKK